MMDNTVKESPSNVAVRLEGVTKFYKLYRSPKDRLKEALDPFRRKYHWEFFALKNVSLEVYKGEVLGLVGANGAGKSTLLKIVCNILPPSAGTVNISGKISAMLELASGFNPDFTGIENIYFYGSLIGLSKEEIKAKMPDILAFAEIGDYVRQPIKSYSSGMKARLAFAVATSVELDILVVDEVLAVGDELFQRKCYAHIEGLVKKKKTILFVSHSVGTINQLCTRAILLDQGRILLQGEPKAVTMQYQRLIYSNKEERSRVRDEIMGGGGTPPETEESKTEEQIVNRDGRDSRDRPGVAPNEKNNRLRPFYLSEFKPKTTTTYGNGAVRIFDLRLQTLDGQAVNALVVDDTYVYSFKVRFENSARDVLFGSGIKTEKAAILTGITAPGKDRPIPQVAPGTEFLVEIRFRCALLPGNYFVDTGVTAVRDGERIFLHRIVDAFVFKVQEEQNDYWGLVHFDQEATVTMKTNPGEGETSLTRRRAT